ncbi:non-functional pseudokinase ZED1-like [Pyrus x bretschneideri]|uniref:non-functional pseudokinase ZED1-like n=1 Tax=Pyrus x bretschneideri TaxID=225117 RepID=UPI0020307BCB|nr:non-functional pseudokinase ZED1-like [Pyrus x bretschneideri]
MLSKLLQLFSKLPFFRKKEREASYYKNLKKLLEDLLASSDGESHPIHCYSADDLIRATNNFSPSRNVKLGSFYPMFRGFLDGRSIIVSTNYNENWPNEDEDGNRSRVIRDIVISLQMSNHDNVLKLLGCCLEFPIPMLVHEYAAKGVLNPDGSLGGASEDQIILPWNIRLRIAKQVASAVSYLHTAFAGAIIHRFLNPSCLFLDDDYVPKLYDFSLSITIPPPDLVVEDAVRGIAGYLDPAYMRSGRISAKTDVYSFGVLLLVFLTGRNVVEFNQAEGYESVISYVLECDGQIRAIVDPKIFEEVGENEQIQQQLHDFLNLALFCTRYRIESRPVMVDVARELVRIEEFVMPS